MAEIFSLGLGFIREMECAKPRCVCAMRKDAPSI